MSKKLIAEADPEDAKEDAEFKVKEAWCFGAGDSWLKYITGNSDEMPEGKKELSYIQSSLTRDLSMLDYSLAMFVLNSGKKAYLADFIPGKKAWEISLYDIKAGKPVKNEKPVDDADVKALTGSDAWKKATKFINETFAKAAACLEGAIKNAIDSGSLDLDENKYESAISLLKDGSIKAAITSSKTV